MKIPTDFQMIIKDGQPEYVVVPYNQFVQLFPQSVAKKTIPHEVVGLMVTKNISRLRAWREYLQFTQKEIADKLKITQAAYSQMEVQGKRLHKKTLEKVADALGLELEQLG